MQLINQNGFNLLWIGAFAVVGGVFIRRGSATAVFMTAIAGWATDAGSFIFMDLGGFVDFVPGTVMTIMSTAAVAHRQHDVRRRGHVLAPAGSSGHACAPG